MKFKLIFDWRENRLDNLTYKIIYIYTKWSVRLKYHHQWFFFNIQRPKTFSKVIYEFFVHQKILNFWCFKHYLSLSWTLFHNKIDKQRHSLSRFQTKVLTNELQLSRWRIRIRITRIHTDRFLNYCNWIPDSNVRSK